MPEKKNFLVLTFFVLLLITYSEGVFAQQVNPKERRSPVGLANYKKGDFYAKVTYGRPYMKYTASYPFGYNVPWRKLWRTGDDDATEVTITKDVTVNDNLLEAGTYALFTIPDTAEWTIIFNKEPGQWGLYNYTPANDVFRTKVPVYKAPGQFREFTIFLQGTPLGADIFLIWDKTSIRIPMVVRKEEN